MNKKKKKGVEGEGKKQTTNHRLFTFVILLYGFLLSIQRNTSIDTAGHMPSIEKVRILFLKMMAA